MTENAADDPSSPPPAGWRFNVGLLVLVVGFISPVFATLLPLLDLPTSVAATVGGLLVFGIPEVFTLAAVAIMGKPGFAFVKAKLLGFLKRHGPPDVVSPTRYGIGLAMFVLPLVYGWVIGYWPDAIPGMTEHRIALSATFDVLFFASVFVLGGQFWDKIRALFVREAYAVLPAKATA